MTGDPVGRAPFVWLASYPKSGNTWFRAILSALTRGEQLFTLDELSSGGQPFGLSPALSLLGLDPRWLTRTEAERLRTDLIVLQAAGTEGPVFRKTHERYRTSPARWTIEGGDSDPPPPFPASATRGAVVIVRDPRDVAVSLAHHFGMSLEAAVDRMAIDDSQRADPGRRLGEQPWGSWSGHTRSWDPAALPFPAFRIRYEDLHVDPVGVLLPALTGVGIDVDEPGLAAAVDRVRMDRLQQDEQQRGFRERHAQSERFFRRGRVGGWRDELPPHLVRAVEADHHEVMTELGYDLTTDAGVRSTTARSRTSARRHRSRPWHRLPEHLGVEVSEGEVPEHLDGSTEVTSWLEVAPDGALVRLVGGTRVLVRDGCRATVHIDPEERSSGDWAWPVQGWAVSLAMLQRGHLVLHAASVECDGRAVAIAGVAGAGKSTTAVGMLGRGWRLLVDDVTILDTAEDGVSVLPYLRGVNLTADAAAGLGLDFANLPHLSAGRGKAVFLGEDPGVTPVPLEAIVVLRGRRTADDVQVRIVTGAERLTLLRRQADRDGAAPAILGDATFFTRVAALASAVPVVEVSRPVGQWSLDSVLDAVVAFSHDDPAEGLDDPGTD